MANWADVEWTNGDYLTETKLDQMQENSDYLRDLFRPRLVWSQPAEVFGADTTVTGTTGFKARMRLEGPAFGANSTETSTSPYTWQQVKIVDQSITSMTKHNFHSFTLILQIYDDTTWDDCEKRFGDYRLETGSKDYQIGDGTLFHGAAFDLYRMDDMDYISAFARLAWQHDQFGTDHCLIVGIRALAIYVHRNTIGW